MQEESLSFVGLGQMGLPLASRLWHAVKGEWQMRVFDRQASRMTPLLEAGAWRASELATVASRGGIVFTRLTDDRQLLQVALGEGGLLKQLGTGGIHVSLSPGSPQVAVQIARLYRQAGASYLSAIVLGRPEEVERGAISLFLAGDQTARTRVRPLLASLTPHLCDLGEQAEWANMAAIGVNVLVASAIEAMGEVAALVEAYGLSREPFLHRMAACPLFQGALFTRYGAERIGPRAFTDDPYPVERGLKEVELALLSAQHKGVALPCADATYEHLLAARQAGRGSEDWSVLSEFICPETEIWRDA